MSSDYRERNPEVYGDFIEDEDLPPVTNLDDYRPEGFDAIYPLLSKAEAEFVQTWADAYSTPKTEDAYLMLPELEAQSVAVRDPARLDQLDRLAKKLAKKRGGQK